MTDPNGQRAGTNSGVREGQRSLACCNAEGHKELDMLSD